MEKNNKELMQDVSEDTAAPAGTGKNKKIKDFMQEELVQSPGRTAARNFFSRKLSIAGMVIFLLIFFLSFSLSAILPINPRYIDSTRQNQPPSMQYLAVPDALAGNARAIDFGSTYGAGIDRAGKLYIWGSTSDTSAKVRSTIPDNMGPLKLLACGQDHISAVAEDGTVYSWGNDRLNITNIASSVRGKNIIDIQAGYQSTLALDDTGRLHFWGNTSQFGFRPGDIQGNITSFAINISTAIVITKDGRVHCVSPSDTAFHNIPDRVHGHASAVASTDDVAAAVLDDGTVVTWGNAISPAIIVPDEIQGRVIDLDGGRSHFTALLDDGSVFSWGDNFFNQCNYPNVRGYSQVSTAYYQNSAIDDSGHVITWGQKGYLMGTDGYGRDILTRLVYGGRLSLTVGFVSVIISAIIGVVIGGVSGYFGGRPDMILMRVAEVVSSIPLIPLLMILSFIVANKVPETWRIVMIMVIIGMLSWPGLARLTRAQFLSEKENEFITAAKAMGIRERVIIFRHILPNVLPVVLVSIMLSMATCMLIESTLSFLNFGVREPTPTWGNMLYSCVDSTIIKKYWWRWVFPSIALGLTTISINVMGDGLRDAIDPKSNAR